MLATLSLQSGVQWAKCIPAVRQNNAKILPDKEYPPPPPEALSILQSAVCVLHWPLLVLTCGDVYDFINVWRVTWGTSVHFDHVFGHIVYWPLKKLKELIDWLFERRYDERRREEGLRLTQLFFVCYEATRRLIITQKLLHGRVETKKTVIIHNNWVYPLQSSLISFITLRPWIENCVYLLANLRRKFFKEHWKPDILLNQSVWKKNLLFFEQSDKSLDSGLWRHNHVKLCMRSSFPLKSPPKKGRNKDIWWQVTHNADKLITIGPGGEGGTGTYGLYRYVPLWRVWFSSSSL